MISANRDENLGLSIVSIDCSKNGTDDDITIHKVPAMPNGEQPTILKEFQGNLFNIKRTDCRNDIIRFGAAAYFDIIILFIFRHFIITQAHICCR